MRGIKHPVLPQAADHPLYVIASFVEADILDPLIVVAGVLGIPLLDRVLAHAPAVLMLSFGDPAPFAPAIRAAGSRLICTASMP